MIKVTYKRLMYTFSPFDVIPGPIDMEHEEERGCSGEEETKN